jgi:hypothetical protein
VPVAATTATADIAIDCTGLNLVFPHGAILAQAPIPDSRGISISTLTTVTAAQANVPTTSTSFPISPTQSGAVYVARTGDGACAKVEPILAGAGAAIQIEQGLSLRGNADCSFAY